MLLYAHHIKHRTITVEVILIRFCIDLLPKESTKIKSVKIDMLSLSVQLGVRHGAA